MDLEAFVLAHLPPVPARVLEVGCGQGDLARALVRAGHDVTAIDPEAPEGPPFRRVSLEDFADSAPFDAVVASRSLHHVHDLGAALDRISGLLRPGGVLVLNEFAKERLDPPTAEWYYERRLELAATGGKEAPASLDVCLREWENDHAELHSFQDMHQGLLARFDERFFAWRPYLNEELRQAASEAQESSLIEAGAIRATGFRWVGENPRR